MIPACFACHVDCAACATEDQVAPFEYDHPPNFEDDTSIHDEELTPPKREPDSEFEGDIGSAHGYVSKRGGSALVIVITIYSGSRVGPAVLFSMKPPPVLLYLFTVSIFIRQTAYS